jgi:hypothetical protein
MIRQTILVSTLVAFSLLTACDRQPNAGNTVPAATTTAVASQPSTQPAAAMGSAATGVIAWGPHKTVQGQTFNVQKDGESGLWIKTSGVSLARGAAVTFDGKLLEKVYFNADKGTVTTTIPAEDLATAGMKHIVLKPSADGPGIDVGDFEVTAP